jgi:Tol biopolymer transport system component
VLTNHNIGGGGNVYQYDLGDGRTGLVILNNYDIGQNIFEYNLLDGAELQVSEKAQDTHPYYNPTGTRIVYAGSDPATDPTETEPSLIFLQCSMLPPDQEVDQRCQNLSEFGALIFSAREGGEIWGSHPVWAGNDTIVYNGCDNWATSSACGIYAVGSGATRSAGNGAVPTQLTQDSRDIPADSKGNLVAFTSQRDGNWEAYIMNLDGANLTNLSNSPDSNDGLPTISPDGNWVAFVSDRQGRWAVWFVSVRGGQPQKMFDLPLESPWVNADRIWWDERISWGP